MTEEAVVERVWAFHAKGLISTELAAEYVEALADGFEPEEYPDGMSDEDLLEDLRLLEAALELSAQTLCRPEGPVCRELEAREREAEWPERKV